MGGAPDRHYRWLFWVVVAGSLGVFFWGLGAVPLLSFNEGRRAVPVQEMLSGDWLVPTLNGERYLSKPPLFYWCALVIAKVAGSTAEWVVRLPSALAGFATTWLAFAIVRKIAGPWPALFTALVLIANANFTSFARRAEIEMLLTALCAGSLFAALQFVYGAGGRRCLYTSYLLAGLAVLAKGPVALLFVTGPLLVLAVVDRDSWVRAYLLDVRGWATLLLVGASWYLVMVAKFGITAFTSVVAVDIAGKVSDARRDPIYDYLMWLLADSLPWSLVLLATPRKTIKTWLASPERRYLFVAVLVPLVIFSLFSDKHAKYLLPAYPAFAALLGMRVAAVYGDLSAERRRLVHGIAAALPVLVMVYYVVLEPRIFSYRFESLPEIAAFLHQHGEPPVYAYQEVDERTLYYYGGVIPVLAEPQVTEKRNAGETFLLLVDSDLVEQLTPLSLCKAAEFAPYFKKSRSAVILGGGAVCAEPR
jgi:4-amino-4-deoxy-L-arabinose transferase-like glycosyltransferase